MPNHVHLVMMPSTEDGLNNPSEHESIKLNSRTGRPLGSLEFVRKLESLTGKELT